METYNSGYTAQELEKAIKAVPSIGENGNWYIGDEDTGIYAGGIKVSGAEVGQTIKVTAVDAAGVPTAWEAADFPSDKWKVVEQTFVHEPGASGALKLSPSLSMQEDWTEAVVYCSITATASQTHRVDCDIQRSRSIGDIALGTTATVLLHHWTRLAEDCLIRKIHKPSVAASGLDTTWDINNANNGVGFYIHWGTIPEGGTVTSVGKIYYR